MRLIFGRTMFALAVLACTSGVFGQKLSKELRGKKSADPAIDVIV